MLVLIDDGFVEYLIVCSTVVVGLPAVEGRSVFVVSPAVVAELDTGWETVGLVVLLAFTDVVVGILGTVESVADAEELKVDELGIGRRPVEVLLGLLVGLVGRCFVVVGTAVVTVDALLGLAGGLVVPRDDDALELEVV